MERRVGYPEEVSATVISVRYLDLKASRKTHHEL
jgi:hypothetical protein